jgi:hypothetical protein
MALKITDSPLGILLSSESGKSVIPTVSFDLITIDTGPQDISSLVIALDLHLKIPRKAYDEDLLKYIGVCLVKSTSEQSSKKIETSTLSASDIMDNPEVEKIYIGPIKNILSSSLAEETSNPDSITKITFQQKDVLQSPESHLSYYAFCYLSLEKLLESYGISHRHNLGPTTSPISGEKIISQGAIQATSFAYYITSPFPENMTGTFWTGPVQQLPSGSWRTMRWDPHPSSVGGFRLVPTSPPMDLERIEVRNSKIQDLRVINQVLNLNIDLIPSDNFPVIIEAKDTFNNSISNPDTYISNAFMARDMKNNCRFMFEYDFLNALIKESRFGKILTNPRVSSETKKKIFMYSPITNLEIKRRRVETARSFNRLGSPYSGVIRPDGSPEEMIIVRTSSNPANKNILKKTKNISPGTGLGNSKDQVVGEIIEILSLKNSPKNTRTIAVTDSSASDLQNGTFQYGANIEMEDGTIKFLNERVRRLNILRTYLMGYYNLKQIPSKNYQSITKIADYYDIFFNTTGRRRRTKDTASPNLAFFIEKTEINNLRTELGFLVGSLTSRETLYPWVIIPEYMVDTIESISDSPKLSNERQISADVSNFALRSMLDPVIATSESILGVIGSLDLIIQKIRTMLGPAAEVVIPNPSTKRLGVSKSPRAAILKIEDYFAELFDANLSYLPSRCYMGFQGSPGRLPSVTTGNSYQIEYSGTPSLNTPEIHTAAAAENTSQTGPLAATAASLEEIFTDEKQIDDSMLLEEIEEIQQEIEEYAAAEREATANKDSDRKREARKAKAAAKKRKENLEEQRKDGARHSNRTSTDGFSKQTHGHGGLTAFNELAQPGRQLKEATDEVFLTPSLMDDKQGTIVEVTTVSENWKDNDQYVRMQNSTLAITTSEISTPNSTNQENINRVMSSLNLEILPTATPMAVQSNLSPSQFSTPEPQPGSLDFLATDDNQSGGTRDSQDNPCIPGRSQGDGSTNLQRCKNEQNSQRLTQNLMNLVSENQKISMAFKKADGNPELLKKLYKKIKNKKSNDYQSPKEELIYGQMAKISIFMGYKKGAAGQIMIKRPVFSSPKSWQEILRHLKSSSDPDDVLLCKLEVADATGPQFVDTNIYFLITKGENTLISQAPKDKRNYPRNRSPVTTPAQKKILKVAKEKGVPPEALKTLYVSKAIKG